MQHYVYHEPPASASRNFTSNAASARNFYIAPSTLRNPSSYTPQIARRRLSIGNSNKSAYLDKLIFVVPTKVRSTRWEVRSESSASLAARHLLSIENTCRRSLPDFILRTSHLVPRTSAYSNLSSSVLKLWDTCAPFSNLHLPPRWNLNYSGNHDSTFSRCKGSRRRLQSSCPLLSFLLIRCRLFRYFQSGSTFILRA
jgi:hypothetical protein